LPSPETRFSAEVAGGLYQERYWHPQMFATVDAVQALARACGMSPAQLAIGWVLSNPVVTAAIVGASSPGQLSETVGGEAPVLDNDVLDTLDKLTVEFRRGDAEH
jgi:aryl-alcohol dehydrogenase-like predicted oxidoreductase